jgi:serine/threonine-protein kinase
MIRRILKISVFAGAFFFVAGISTYLTLHLIVKSGSGTVVPDLAGEHVVAALELLSDLSLNTRIKGMEYNSDVPIHHVISQSPDPGSEIKPGRDVRITLSKGPETIRMPSITGLSLSQSRIVLDENGLSVGNIARIYDEHAYDEEVLSQVPASGRIIHRDSPVDLLVSIGARPGEFIMPNLTGLSVQDAVKRIENMNLTLGHLDTLFHPDAPMNRIVEQSPASGYRVSERDTISLSINRKKGSETGLSDLQSGLKLMRYTTPPGFLNRHVRLRLNAYDISTDVMDSFVRSGTDLWFLIPTQPATSAFLYVDDILVASEVIE